MYVWLRRVFDVDTDILRDIDKRIYIDVKTVRRNGRSKLGIHA